MFTKQQGSDTTVEERKQWLNVQKARIHERQKMMIWKVLKRVLPTLDRLARFMQVAHNWCYLCQLEDETIHHLFFECLVSRAIWWNSPWQLRLESFQHRGLASWIHMILEDHNSLPLPADDKRHMKHFLGTALDLIWYTRNKCWREQSLPNLEELSKLINSTSKRYLSNSNKLCLHREEYVGGIHPQKVNTN